ncbi:hypothetical protein DY000_02018874 [Brassica cretica]|uniref:Uncharacterized protein n=1 Tax=Brassica cretica TaxID=69181 RepID=A0ABQ7D287_BRACR|nr:hypothetical protein DY000_02018874 [Brassica cretica]
MSQRLSLPCRLVKDGPSDNVQVHPNQMDARGNDKDACGTVRMVRRMRMHVCLRFLHHPSQHVKSGMIQVKSGMIFLKSGMIFLKYDMIFFKSGMIQVKSGTVKNMNLG